MTLDTKRTFDDLVERYAPDAEARRRILDNRFYVQVSSALAGSHEYMAMERLLELSADDRFDLVVLDTPPTRHALDFLEAPERMMRFLDAGVLRWFLKPYFVAGRLTLKVATRTGAAAMRIADRYLGLQFLQDLSEFFLAFEGMYGGFKERAARVYDLLREDASGFVLVSSPSSLALEEALYFHRRLTEKQMPFAGFVVNRVRVDPDVREGSSAGAAHVAPDLAERLVRVYQEQQMLARIDARRVSRLRVDTHERVVIVPELEADVHDLRGLAEVGRALTPVRSVGRPRARPSARRRKATR
jgi:anion-transporting  ArsA/GET3 family ATPase